MIFHRLLAPYHKNAIFYFCGIEFVLSAFLMAISNILLIFKICYKKFLDQKFWDLASRIFPIAYRIFNDTLLKGVDEFRWENAELQQLNRVGLLGW